jgi:hypothetical protein
MMRSNPQVQTCLKEAVKSRQYNKTALLLLAHGPANKNNFHLRAKRIKAPTSLDDEDKLIKLWIWAT